MDTSRRPSRVAEAVLMANPDAVKFASPSSKTLSKSIPKPDTETSDSIVKSAAPRYITAPPLKRALLKRGLIL
jgi:hypothetical protein